MIIDTTEGEGLNKTLVTFSDGSILRVESVQGNRKNHDEMVERLIFENYAKTFTGRMLFELWRDSGSNTRF